MHHSVFKISLKTELTRLDFFVVFEEFKARDHQILFSARFLMDFIWFLFLFIRLLANLVLFGALIIGHIVFMAVRMHRILLKLGYTVGLLCKNLLWHSLHFLSEVINSLFSPHPLIFNGLVSLLADCLDDIVFQVVDSLSKWGEVAFDWFRIRGEYAQEILELGGNTASNWSYDVNFNIF